MYNINQNMTKHHYCTRKTMHRTAGCLKIHNIMSDIYIKPEILQTLAFGKVTW